MKIIHIPLSPSTSHRQAQSILLSKVLLVINELSLRYKTYKIYLSDRHFHYHTGSTLTPTETKSFSNLVSLGLSAQVFLATNPSSPGVLLARHWAKAPSTSTMPQLFSHKLIKDLIRSKLNEVWNREWIASAPGSWTRKLFPYVQSSRALLKLKSNTLITQIQTGHYLLNAHQHRFSFSTSSACFCVFPVSL